jgi:alpha-galactosidase
LNATTGVITGTIAQRGRYPVTFTARNSVGTATRQFTFVAEGKLSLTPALGWNSWNVYGRAISDSLARVAADVFVSKGLIDHGWTYINLDDGWERAPERPANASGVPARPPVRSSRTRSFRT